MKDEKTSWKIHPGEGFVALAWVLPWLTWIQFQSTDLDRATTETPILLFQIGMIAIIGMSFCVVLKPIDPILTLGVIYLSLNTLRVESPFSLETSFNIVLGLYGMHCVRSMSMPIRDVINLLSINALLQSLYTLHQAIGYDLIWCGFHPCTNVLPRGTLGNGNFTGAYLGILIPLCPPTLMPVIALGLILTKSIAGIMAGTIGLIWRYRQKMYIIVDIVFLFLLSSSIVLYLRPNLLSFKVRWIIHTMVLKQWVVSALPFGHGPGTWWLLVPEWQKITRVWGNEWFRHAHDEYFQFVFEQGLVGSSILGWWLIKNRRVIFSLVGPSIVAILVNCFAMHPFHLGAVAPTIIVIMGLGLREMDKETTDNNEK